MKKYLKDKRILAAGAVILILIALGIGFFALSGNNSSGEENGDEFSQDQPVETITAEEIGLVITVRPDGRAVMFEIENADDIEHIDYQIIYDHELDGETVTEGITGEMNIGEDGITKTDYRPFGTCSASVCRYDEGVANVKLVMKIEKTDGKVYSLEQEIPLEEE